MKLSEKQKKYLRGLAHPRNPVVLIGQQGLTPGVVQELDGALAAHELVKIRARVERDERDALLARLGAECRAELVQRIGHVAVFYRRHPENPRIVLPD